jgi:hypothetical protein
MCRDGFRATCVVVGCDNVVTCRDGNGYCHDHDPWEYEGDPDAPSHADDPVKVAMWDVVVLAKEVDRHANSLAAARRRLSDAVAKQERLAEEANGA